MKTNQQHYWHFLVLINLMVALACNASQLRFGAPTPTSQYPMAKPTKPQPESLITFQVQLPGNTPLKEPIFLNVLDEVTGLALNVQRFEMQAEDDLNYTITLPFPVGSTIKYRYSRLGTYTALEQTSDKHPVRYRLYHVEGPGTVKDVVSTWSDTAFKGTTGRIMGTTTDAQTGGLIPNLLITAGGSQTLTASDGSFLMEGLPPGTHNLVAYAMDGSYRTFQQGAVVAAESTTPAPIQLVSTHLVNIVFTVIVPRDTLPAVPIRMAGNLTQLGNTFADLTGGVSTLASRMPLLTPLPDGRYSMTLTLPSGTDVHYKYTLGDGFWNAEHTTGGEFRLRHLIVPETNTIVEDMVESWGTGTEGPILFDLTVPRYTPQVDSISIQFNPFGWTEPMPMWFIEEHHWAYVLYSPLNIFEKLGYRYCRNEQCGSADDAATPGPDTFGRVLEINPGLQNIKDTVESWIWIQPEVPLTTLTPPEARARGPDFMAGVELQPAFHPSWTPRLPVTIKELTSLGANWVVLSPTWTYTRKEPPVLEPVTGWNASWNDVASGIERGHTFGLKVALNPTPHFTQAVDEWWASSTRDFAWWLVWFDRYRNFLLHHADLAQREGAEAIIIGGDWIIPALPSATLPDGSPSGVPPDAENRWRELLEEVRSRFGGTVIWALPYSPGFLDAPPFLEAVDQVYLLWSLPLADQADALEPDLYASASVYLDGDVKYLQELTGKPVILGIDYPSAEGGITGCLPDPTSFLEGKCLNLDLLNRPNPDLPTISLDLERQAQAYNALLVAVNERDWISGFISRDYYPPAALQDKSTSVHGKPAAEVLAFWFPRLVETQFP